MQFIALYERVNRQPLLGAFSIGLVLAILSVCLSGLVYGVLSLLLPKSLWGASAATQAIGTHSGVSLFFVAVLLIPILETVIGQIVPIEIARRAGAGPTVCIFASASVFGGGHFLNGGIAHGITTASVGLILALGYVMVRPNGFWSSCIAAGTAHAAHNAILLFVVAWIFPEWA